jgi:uracil-DNA glycosylase
VLEQMPNVQMTILLGKYAQDWHLDSEKGASLTESVLNWRAYWPKLLPLPHPSPRNISWFKKNAWFEAEVIPCLQCRAAELLD